MQDKFQLLFSPIGIGPMTVRNRIWQLPHFTGFNLDGVISDRYVAYLTERARGGVGAIVTGQQMVHPSSEHKLNEAFGFDEKVIPMYRRLADSIHENGCKLIFQLGHVGRQTDSSLSRIPILAPSAIPHPPSREIPKAMDPGDIREVIQGYAKVTSHARAAGADGVEIHGSSGYLVQQFMSPYTNHRTDAYGGSTLNRSRFLLEILEEVRAKAGSDLAVGIRLCGDEFIAGGLTLDDMVQVASTIASTNRLDYISVSVGSNAFPVGMGTPLGLFVYFGARIKSVVKLPVIVSCRIIDPVHAERILADGHADLIGMARALICDPEFANKAKTGRSEDIRTCVGCNEGCLERSARAKPITCIQNAAVGYERQMGVDTIKPAPVKKKVLIAGGGPAGMEAARIAALRGHEVHLYEKGNELGGQVNLASRIPWREEFAGIARFLGRQVRQLGVNIHLGVEVTAEIVAAASPDVVIVAIGSRPARLPVPGGDQDNVLSAWDAVSGAKQVGQKVLMVDDDGHHKGADIAIFLAEQSKQVEVVTRLASVALDLASIGEQAPVYRRLLASGAVVTPFSVIRRIAGGTVTVTNIFSESEEERRDVDTIVAVVANQADGDLYASLKGKVKELHAVGDCVAPRRAMDAIFDANRTARLI